MKVGSCEWSSVMRGTQLKPQSFSVVAASPYQALSRLTMNLREVRPVAALHLLLLEVLLQRVVVARLGGLRDIAGQQVVERRDIG